MGRYIPFSALFISSCSSYLEVMQLTVVYESLHFYCKENTGCLIQLCTSKIKSKGFQGLLTFTQFSINSTASQNEELKDRKQRNCGNRMNMRTQRERKGKVRKQEENLVDGKNEWKKQMRNGQKLNSNFANYIMSIPLSCIIFK